MSEFYATTQLNSYAFHEPQKMPTFEKWSGIKAKAPKAQSQAEFSAQLLMWARRNGLKDE